MNKSPGPGRRRGRSNTREEILAIARRRFLAEGYQAVTMRSIATQAGVDAALISYFFGSKQGLFGAALALKANPVELISAAVAGELQSLPDRLLRTLLATWDDPVSGAPLRALAQAALSEPGVAQLLREAVQREMVERIAQRLGGEGARTRAAMLSVQLSGVIFTRYVLQLEPIASMPADEIVRRLAPSLRLAVLPQHTLARAAVRLP
jgi:AcrR family transcriptional regulator